jgi:hypothetical protein
MVVENCMLASLGKELPYLLHAGDHLVQVRSIVLLH